MATASNPPVARMRSGARSAGRELTARIDADAAAWLALLPCAAVVALAIHLLGPPLGSALLTRDNPPVFWEVFSVNIRPEPTEQARYLLALGGPLLLALATIVLTRRALALPARAVRASVVTAQAAAAAFVAVCLVQQFRFSYGELWSFRPGVSFHRWYFTPATLVVAALIAGGVAYGAGRPAPRTRFAALVRDRRWSLPLATLTAALATVVWLLQGVNSDRSIANAIGAVAYHVEFTYDETYAVLDGLTPLVDFTAQYGSLWPFPAALLMSWFGATLLVFTIVMSSITALAMVAVYDLLRRVARSALGGLLLYLPFLATSFFLIRGTTENRYSMATYFGGFPLRYAAPYLVAWLTALRLQRGRRRLDWLLFAAAGLALLNNVDFGVAAFGATIAAIVWTSGRLRPRALALLAADAAVGLALAAALVALLTLIRAGSLPEFGRLVEYAGIYAVGGFQLLPVPGALGLHTIIYVTYVAAIGTATVRALADEEDRLLTGLLAWSGVFGLGSAAYYMGRSHPESLVSTFSAWALALMLLTVVVVRGDALEKCRPTIAALTVLFGFGVAACSLAQTPTPWSQLQRIDGAYGTRDVFIARAHDPFVPREQARTFFSSTYYDGRMYVKRGAPVANLATGGHVISAAFDVRNVSRYTGTSVVGPRMLKTVIADLRAAGGNTLFLFMPTQDEVDVVMQEGFVPLLAHGWPENPRGALKIPGSPWATGVVSKWRDTYNPAPAYLEQGRGRPVPLVTR